MVKTLNAVIEMRTNRYAVNIGFTLIAFTKHIQGILKNYVGYVGKVTGLNIDTIKTSSLYNIPDGCG